jgi:predicted nucleic acid-binding protein
MTILLDTNVIMDALQERQPFDATAKEILRLSERGALTCLFTANAATDVFFLYAKARDMQSARVALSFLLSHYKVVSVAQEDCIEALSVAIDDFEDALVAVCAAKAKVDCIVTRDEAFLRSDLPVPRISPGEFLKKLSETNK